MEILNLWLHLLSTPELGRNKIRKLLNLFGSPENFIGCDRAELHNIAFLTDQQKNYLSQSIPDQTRIMELIDQYNIKYITCLDDEFPTSLLSIYDPPVILFYRGDLTGFSQRNSLAVVGTRRPSNYGKTITRELAGKLADSGFELVSGLAYGVDSIVHNAALKAGTRTIAVMATGVDKIYPQGNKSLAEKIINNGTLISEYIPGSKAEKWYFPTRNRIISGLCRGCIVIEGSKKSGALLTARFAMDQNRDVFAVPGDINREQAAGPNYLLKMGAKPVTEVNDILEEYNIQFEKTEKRVPNLSKEEKMVYQLIMNNKPGITFDQIICQSDLQVNSLSTLLLNLELRSLIRKLPGNVYSVS